MGEDRNTDGRFTPQHTDGEILAAVRTHEPAATSEVAKELDVSRQAVDYRLRKLRENGSVQSKKIGASLVWFAPDRSATDGVENHTGGVDGDRNTTPSERRETAHTASETNAFEGIEFPSGKDPAECKATIYAARDYLKESGPCSKSEIVTELMPEHALGYDTEAALSKIEDGERYRGAWWRHVVKPGLEAIENVQKPAPGQSKWRYSHD